MDPITLLSDLIAIDSINPFETVTYQGRELGVGREQAMAARLSAELERIGFLVTEQVVQERLVLPDRVIPRRCNILAEKGEGPASILFFGHMDTVGISEGWDTEALVATAGTGEDGEARIYGLGANDMKGGLAAILAALDGLEAPRGYRVKVAFLVDEEFWSFGAVSLLEHPFLDDVQAALVPEIGDFENKTSQAAIILGRMGRCEYKVSVQGVSCHGAQSRSNPLALNAVAQSARMQVVLEDYIREVEGRFTHGKIGIDNSVYVNHHTGGRRALSVPEQASFFIDRSFTPGEDMEGEAERLRAFFEQRQKAGDFSSRLQWTLGEGSRPTPKCVPYFWKPEHPFVRFVTPIVKSVTGGYEYGIAWSVADENRLSARGIPTLVLGPRGRNCHAKNEWVEVRSLLELTQVYRRIAREWRPV